MNFTKLKLPHASYLDMTRHQNIVDAKAVFFSIFSRMLTVRLDGNNLKDSHISIVTMTETNKS